MLLGEAQTLTDRFQFIDGRIQALSSEINLRLGTVVSEINGSDREHCHPERQDCELTAADWVKRPQTSWMSGIAH